MLTEICADLRNYFLVPGGIHTGTFDISGGKLAPLDFVKDGQYVRIVGSLFNDGVYQYPVAELTDESFTGAVWALAIPPNVKALADEIKAYEESEGAKPSPYTSESFGNYSYTKASGANGAPLSWKAVFADRLKNYRRMSVL